jgi:hypothetical protein
MVERDLHWQNDASLTRWTERGIEIDESDEQSANVSSSMDKSLDPDSNVTVERER